MINALEGLRVLDFTQNQAGPLTTMLLADFGADVVKVEPPDGDTMRKVGETFFGEDSVYFLSMNRNKRSVVLDLTTIAGREVAHRLVPHFDIVVENFRPGVAERLGIGYDELKAINSKIIYCSISAFGRDGPDSSRPGLDPVVQAMSGVMQLTGDQKSGPMKMGLPFADVVTPLLMTSGVLAAVQARNRTKQGQRVDLSMLDTSIFCMMPREAFYFATGATPGRIGNAHWEIVPYNTYRTADGRDIMVIAYTDKFWRVLAAAVEADELLADSRLATKAGRLAYREVVDTGLAKAFARHPLEHWNSELAKAGAMFAPVRTFPEVFEDPHVKQDLIVELQHPTVGKFKNVRNPLKLSGTPATIRRIPPRLGEHTHEVLAQFGLPDPAERPVVDNRLNVGASEISSR